MPSPNTPSITVPNLLITRKETVKDPNVRASFRQLERWSNSHQWSRPLASSLFGSGWSGSVRYLVDSLGFVHLHGQVTNSSSPPTGATILTLPSSLTPQSTWEFTQTSDLGILGNFTVWLYINSNGTITYNTGGATPGAATFYLDPCYYDPTV